MKAKKKCLIHIGIGKAGSSSIQAHLSSLRLKLAEHNILYPYDLNRGFLGGDNQKSLPLSLSKPSFQSPFFRHQKITPSNHSQWTKDVIETLKRQTRYFDGVLLLSAEQFWSECTTVNSIENLKLVLDSIGVEVVGIVMYVRRQDQWMESYAAQKCRELSFNLSKFDAEYISNYAVERLSYYETVNLWGKIFRKAQLIVRPFDKKYWHKGHLISDFFSILENQGFLKNPNLLEIASSLDHEKSVNVTSSNALSMYVAMRLVQASKSRGPSTASDRVLFNRYEMSAKHAISSEAIGKRFIPPRLSQTIMQLLAHDNTKLWDHYINAECPWYDSCEDLLDPGTDEKCLITENDYLKALEILASYSCDKLLFIKERVAYLAGLATTS